MRITTFLSAITCVIVLALHATILPGLPQQTTIRSEVSLVNVYFSALDKKGKPVNGLKAEDFQVLENRVPQKIEFFSETGKRQDMILTIALLIDTSGSVKDKLRHEVATASEFFREILRPKKDLALIIQFDSEVNLVQDYTQDLNKLDYALNSVRAGGETSLYDAIYLASEEKLRDEAGRKVMVVISDGEDTASLVSKEEAIESAQKSDALIFGIGVRGRQTGGGFGGVIGNGFGDLQRFCDETGGAFFSPEAKFGDIQEAFRSIRETLQGQYSLAYSPTDETKDGTYRAIEVRCKNRGVRIRARKGYYAPKEEWVPGNPSSE